MKVRSSVAVVILLLSSWVAAEEKPAAMTGWRGDGSGVYPNANPPVIWQRASPALTGLRFQAQPPKSDTPTGTLMSDGIIREWLMLGPVNTEKNEDGKLIDSLLVEDQTALAPVEGKELAGAKWQIFKTDTAYLDCALRYASYGKTNTQVAYAQTYLYAPAEMEVLIRLMHSARLHVWLNGKPTHKFNETDQSAFSQLVKLQKGWNRLLLRITPQQKTEQAGVTPPWYASVVLTADPKKAQYEQKGIAWRSPLPAGNGCGGPIVVSNKIFLLSEPADLVCLDATTGKILWMRSNNYHDLTTPEERKAQPEIFNEADSLATRLKTINDSFATGAPPISEVFEGSEQYKEKVSIEKKLDALMKRVDPKKYTKPSGQDVGYAGFTPISDGKRIWGWSALGVSFCYDLEGKLIWRRLDNEGSFFEHGYSTSPVLADGKLIVFMKKLIAFDAATGNRLWTTELDQQIRRNRIEGTPAVTKIGTTPVCILPNSLILRLTDGRIIHDKGAEIATDQQEIPSPIIVSNVVYRISTYSKLFKVTLPTEASDPLPVDIREVKINVDQFPNFYLPWHLSSPLVYEGLAYLLNNTGVLTVVDVEKMAVIYQKLLDLDHFQNNNEGAGRGIGVSPALAGGKIYLMGNTGVTLVIKPGRTYEPLARNQIESIFTRRWGPRHERFIANPSFDGKRMFIRGEKYLYCLSE